jgi:hypothetical protein
MSGVKSINNSSNTRINGENKQDDGLEEDAKLLLLLEQSQKVLDKNMQKNLVANTKNTNPPNLAATDGFKTPSTLTPTINNTSKNDVNVEDEDDNEDLNALLNVLENSQQSRTHTNASILHNNSVNNHASINVTQKTQKESNEVFCKGTFFLN